MFSYLDMINNSNNLAAGLEARAMQRAKTFSIIKSDFFLAPKITDPVTVFSFDQNEESALNTFRDISTRVSKMKAVRFKGYYVKQRYIETISAKRIMKNMRPVYAEVNKKKKEFNITTVSMKTKVFKTMSYMVNLGYLLNEIKLKTFDKGLLMNTKTRESILNALKNNIKEASLDDHEKILYFKGPFLSNTKIGLNIVDSMLLKVWNPLVLLLEWFFKDEEGFKKWMVDNKINIVLDNGQGQFLVLSRSEIYQNLPMFNFKYCIRLIHRLDGADLKDMGLTQDEIDLIETEMNQASSEVEPINEEELNEMELVPDPEIEEEDLEEEMPEFLEVEEVLTNKFSDSDPESKAKTSNEINRIFDEVPEQDRGTELLELHNYRSLSTYIETDNVKSVRQKMLKNYGKDVKEVVNNIANHQIEVAQFNNTVDNDFNKSTFVKLDKSYQDKLYNTDLENILISPANLSFPLFLQDYSITDISDREYRGDLLKASYLTHDGETLEFEMEIPRVVNNSIFMGGSEKYLTNQDLALPIIKTDEEVIITMAYNKTILAIKGKYANANDKVLVKTIQNFASKNDAIKVKTTEELSDFIYANRMSYRMIHMNKHFGGIRYKDSVLDIDFDFRGIEVVESGLTTCGHVNGDTIIHAPWKDKFWIGKDKTSYDTESFIKHLLSLIDADLLKESEVTKLDNLNFVNSIYCTIMARDIPIVLVMLIETPLKDLLERLKNENDLEYSVVKNDKLEISKLKNTTEYGYIILEDYTIRVKYNNTINQLILVPLINMDLRKYTIFDIAHIMKDMVGSDNLSIYLENFATSFIDPGSKRVLDMLNIPSDYTGLFIYAATLFYDYKTSYSSDAGNYRLVTPSEVITRIFYEKVIKELTGNVARTKRGSRQMITLPRDTVNKTLMTTMTNISEDSNISPFRSIMLKSSKSQKGHMGINMSRAFNMKRRMFNQNNLGTETFATAYSGQAGIIKYLPFNPKFADLTGRYLNQDTPKGLDPSNMSTFVDAFVPYLTYDDSPRRIKIMVLLK